MSRSQLDRRSFLRLSGAGLGALAVTNLLTACGQVLGVSAEESHISLSGLGTPKWLQVRRPDDLVVVDFGLFNLKRVVVDGRIHLVKNKVHRPALIVAQLPSQHLHERQFAGPPQILPVEHQRADGSRLVFHIADGQLPLELSIAGLLRACAQSGLNVAAGAALPGGIVAIGTTSGSAIRRNFDPLETMLELPFRLGLSPNNAARFAHSAAPMVSPRGRAELWHTRLVRSEHPTMRALHVFGIGAQPWGYKGEVLSDDDREDIVASSSSPANPPIQVQRLELSALGAWFDASLDLVGRPLGHWDQRSAMGRDMKVVKVYPGRLVSPCHRSAMIETTVRTFSEGSHPQVYLHVTYTMALIEEVRHYHDPALLPDMATHQRRWPFRSMRVLTRSTPPLDPPTEPGFYQPSIDGIPFEWEVEAEDARGEKVRFKHAFGWIPEEDLAPPREWWPGPIQPAKLGGQRVALAPIGTTTDQTKREATTLETHAMTIECVELGSQLWDRYDCKFAPVLAGADVVIEAMATITGTTGPVAVTFPRAYLESGLDHPSNPNDLFLTLTGAVQRADFVKSGTDKVGGFIAPNLDVAGMSRLTGPVTAALVAYPPVRVSPDALFPIPKNANNVEDLLDSFCPRLFGCISLKQILSATNLDLEAMAPKFVTEALDEIQRLRQIGTQLYDRAADLVRQVQAAHDAIDSTLTDLKAHALAIRNFFDENHSTYVVTAITEAVAKIDEVIAAPDPDNVAGIEATATFIQTRIAQLQVVGRFLADPKTVKIIEHVPLDEAASLLRTTRRMVCGMMDVLESAANVVDVLLDAAVAFAKARKMVKDKTVKIEWRPELQDLVKKVPGVDLKFTPSQSGKRDNLLLSVELRAKQRQGQKAGADVLCSLENFELELLEMLGVKFKRLQFRQRMSQKPEIDVVFSGIQFLGPLSFVDTLRDILPLDGFSDPPSVKIDASGLDASYSLALPNVAIGMFSLENIRIGARLLLPLLGDAIRIRFEFSKRQEPFLVTCALFGGGGFFELELTPEGLRSLVASIQFGAQLSASIGVASGSLSIMGGFVYEMAPGKVNLYGFLRIRGECDILGLVSASIELHLQLGYVDDKLKGKASLLIEISVSFFSISVAIEAERTFAGSNGDPPFVEMVSPDAYTDYLNAFAA